MRKLREEMSEERILNNLSTSHQLFATQRNTRCWLYSNMRLFVLFYDMPKILIHPA